MKTNVKRKPWITKVSWQKEKYNVWKIPEIEVQQKVGNNTKGKIEWHVGILYFINLNL